MFVVHLKPYWCEARIDTSLVSYQKSSDIDSCHRSVIFLCVLIFAFFIVVCSLPDDVFFRAGAGFGSHQKVFSVGLTGFDSLCEFF